jgi:molecular chaperone DnaJ
VPDAEERFKEIAEAYAVLLFDSKRRADYDARGFPSVEGCSTEDLAGRGFGGVFRGLGFGVDLGAGPSTSSSGAALAARVARRIAETSRSS